MNQKENFDNIVSKIRSSEFIISEDLLVLANQALERLKSREDEDIDKWAKTLANIRPNVVWF